jgi:hypothetical protein
MRRIVSSGGLVAGIVALAVASASGAPHSVDSGIRGLVVVGPTCPVQRPGQNCTRPYRAWITIRRQRSHVLAVHVRSGSDGVFVARLSPGRYLLQPHNGRPYPHARSQTVTVGRHRFTEVTVSFDSGIR